MLPTGVAGAPHYPVAAPRGAGCSRGRRAVGGGSGAPPRAPPGGEIGAGAGGGGGGGGGGRDVAVEAGGVPAPGAPVEGVGAGTHGLIRRALPIREVVAALMPWPGPVADLVPAPAVLREARHRVLVHGGRPIVVLGRPRSLAPVAGPTPGGQMV